LFYSLLRAVVTTLLARGPSLEKNITDGPLCYADTSCTASGNCIVHRSVNVSSRMCGPLVAHLDHVENHWFRVCGCS